MKRKALSIIMAAAMALTATAQTFALHPWQGKRVAYFGDSITDPRHKGATTKYWQLLQEWLGITPYVYAVSGRQWNDIPRQADKLKEEHGDDFDAILIFIGTNDYNAGVPLGEWFEEKTDSIVVFDDGTKRETAERLRRIPVTGDATYRGRINTALSKLKAMFPEKQIVLLTPIHRSVYFNKKGGRQQPEDCANKCGEFLGSYVDAVKEAGQLWAMPVIDLGADCGLFPLYDGHAQYFADPGRDRLHPNDKGHCRMAKTLLYRLASLPCDF